MDAQNPVAGVFDRAAPTYDRVGVDFFQPIAEQLVTRLAPAPGERALDVGCGRGAVLFPLARAVAPAGRVTGVDVSTAMVEMTAPEAEAVGRDADVDVAVRVGDAVLAEDVIGDRGPFDVIASSLVLFFLRDPVAALVSWAASRAPGGRIGVSTFGPYNVEWRAVDEQLNQYRPPEVRDPRAIAPESPFTTDTGVEGLFEAAGLTDARTETTTIEVRFDDEEHWHAWSWSVGQRAMWERIPEADRERVRDDAFAALQRCRDGAGRIGFDQTVRYTLSG